MKKTGPIKMMKTWLKKVFKLESESKTSLIENFQTIYGHYTTLLKARQEALEIMEGIQAEPSPALSGPLKSLVESLNMISNQCSLDLVKTFQEIQCRIEKNPSCKPEALFLFPFPVPLENLPQPGPFPVKPFVGLQDLLNYTHELAIEAMFDLLDRFDPSWTKAIKVQTGLPINLHVMDLKGGLFSEIEKKVIQKQEILSEPMLAMFKGMYYPGISWSGPIGVNLKGLMVIMAQSTSR
ncbi:MAG: hypothetical protein C0407_05350, partial [Desulfobacca sp.]|nr:hypothetical protein [Desulfobacca sp.]